MSKQFKFSKRLFILFEIHIKPCNRSKVSDFKLYLFPNLKIQHSNSYNLLGNTTFSLRWLYYEISLILKNKN